MRFHTGIGPSAYPPIVRGDVVILGDESLEETKKRLDALWGNYTLMKEEIGAVQLFDRVTPRIESALIDAYLTEKQYPPRTRIDSLHLDTWKVSLNTKFIRDGFMYVLRGDNPGLASKGFYSKVYGYGKHSALQMEQLLTSPREVGYFLYESELFLTHPMPSYANIAEELMYSQSAIGGSTFVSTTTSIPCAVMGTGVRPNREVQSVYEVYVLKVPVEFLINSNTENYFGINEDEVLVADYIASSEVVATFARADIEGVYSYLHMVLGVTREDVRMGETDTRGESRDGGRERQEARYKMVP